ncbi:LysR family transcriptional regulator, partial [Burkholderia sp. SIMBA_019]
GHDHPILTSVPLVEPVVKRRVGIVRRRGRPLTPAAQEFHRTIIETKRAGVARNDAVDNSATTTAKARRKTAS